MTKWHPEDGGYKAHVTSAINEWIMTNTFMAYILTFHKEFRNVEFEEPPITLSDKLLTAPKVFPQALQVEVIQFNNHNLYENGK